MLSFFSQYIQITAISSMNHTVVYFKEIADSFRTVSSSKYTILNILLA